MMIIKKFHNNGIETVLKSSAIMVSKFKKFHNVGTKNFKKGFSVVVPKKFHNNGIKIKEIRQ